MTDFMLKTVHWKDIAQNLRALAALPFPGQLTPFS